VRQHQAGHLDEAVAGYWRVLALTPDHTDALNNLGVALTTQGRLDEAVAHYERAVVLRPDYADAYNNLGNTLALQGKFDEASARFGRAISIRPAYAEAHFNRSEIKTFGPGDPDEAALEALAASNDLPADKMPYIHFALAKALEDRGDSGRAFEHLRKGNELKRSQIHYDEAAVLKFFQRVAEVFTSRLFDRFRGAGDPSLAPIFVLGMPRSGSTLIEQILASHPQIHGAGELTDLGMAASAVLNELGGRVPYPDCLPDLDATHLRRMGEFYLSRLPIPATGKVRIVDKLPDNFFYIGLIRLILPNAKIIHTLRNPIDTCVSCYSKLFASGQTFSYDLAELGRFYLSYRELMAHWRTVLPPGAMLEVAYENVVDNLEGEARRLIDYCGLAWDDSCLSFHKTSRPVKTASAAQVRKPLFRTSLERWRKNENSLGSLLNELGNAIPADVLGQTVLASC